MAIELLNPESVPLEVKISIDGNIMSMLVNPGRVTLPPNAELKYLHPKLKNLGGSAIRADQTALDFGEAVSARKKKG